MEEFDKTKYIPLFKEEVFERIQKVTEGLLALEKDTGNKDIILQLQRQTHTIKGTAYMLGFEDISQISHSLEDSFSALLDGKSAVSSEFINQVLTRLDRLKDILERSVRQETAFLKIPLEKINRLSILSLDISQEKRQLQQGLEDLKKLSVFVQGIKNPSDADIEKINSGIGEFLKESYAVQDRLDILSDEMLKDIQMMRIVTLSSFLQDFPRMLRDIALQEKKKVELLLDTGSVGIDRFISEDAKSCLIHILRNAIRHGIESPEERMKANKSPLGKIRINSSHKNNYVAIEVQDDGRGIAPQMVKEVVLKKGLIDEIRIRQMSDQEIVKLVLLPGFSSSVSVDNLSGRGIGLDAVRESVERLGGKMDIESEEGEFTKVSLLFPLTMGLVSTVLVESAEQIFAIPVSFIQKSLEIMSAKDFSEPENLRHQLKLDNSYISVVELNKFLNLPIHKQRSQDYPRPVIILSSRGKSVGLMVDKILGSRELLLKGRGRFLGRARFFQGAGLLKDNRIALILNVPAIFAVLFPE